MKRFFLFCLNGAIVMGLIICLLVVHNQDCRFDSYPLLSHYFRINF